MVWRGVARRLNFWFLKRPQRAAAFFFPPLIHFFLARRRDPSDLGSTVYYIGGLAEHAIGKAAIVHTAARLGSTQVVMGESNRITRAEQARLLRAAWQRLDTRTRGA
jgi:hypothetical protein